MRKKSFEVPVDSMIEFAEVIEENQLMSQIVGTNDEDDIMVEVEYERSQRDAILDLMELLEVEVEE
jgi:hypothetical protein